MRALFILGDGPYGSERPYNRLRLAGTSASREGCELKVFLIGDAASGVKSGQKVPEGYYGTMAELPIGRRGLTRCWCSERGEISHVLQATGDEKSIAFLFFRLRHQGQVHGSGRVAGDEEWFIEEAQKAGVTINYVIGTHVHADHYSGGRKPAQMVGAPYCLHESDIPPRPTEMDRMVAANITGQGRANP